jgi:signal transduction histidine kinase/ActR/RegA family two-component response regulator
MLAARPNSIRKNFTAVVLATTFAALLVAATALLFYEAKVYHESGVANLQAQAELLARTTAPALAFDDRKAAMASLDLLSVRKDILAAVLYTPAGTVFAAYRRSAGDQPVAPLPRQLGTRIEQGEIVIVNQIVENNVVVGTLVLRGQYELWNRLGDYLLILGAVMLGSLVVALLISSRLQRAVTEPIVALTVAVRNVVERRDFSHRVPKTTDGEIGILIDGFNTMLAEVGTRAEELEASNRELRRETADRAAAESALRIADRRKDEFLAVLAHELRNPLAPISNALAILSMATLDPKLLKVRDMMERQLRQLVRLVDDLLDVSRITTDKLVLRKEVVDLAEVIQGAADTVKPLFEARQHQLHLHVAPQSILLEADGVRLSQVISNLLNNSAKFSEPGGRVDVHVQLDGGHVEVRVTDTGIGISEEMLSEVFEMFRQADNSIEKIRSGLGVGLTLAKRLVELHGGTISASSRGLGEGSEFVVRLPVVNAASYLLERRAPEMPSRAAGVAHRVLIVDDNVDFADTLAALLNQLGHQVRIAHSAEDALKVAPAYQADIAFLDIGMPGMSGYELAKRLRSRPETAHLVLIAVTGYGQERDRELAREAGFDRHLMKPVEFSTVVSMLEEFSDGMVAAPMHVPAKQ